MRQSRQPIRLLGGLRRDLLGCLRGLARQFPGLGDRPVGLLDGLTSTLLRAFGLLLLFPRAGRGLFLRLVERLAPLSLLREADALEVLLRLRARIRIDLAHVFVHLPGGALGVVGAVLGLLGQGQGPRLLLACLFRRLVSLPQQRVDRVVVEARHGGPDRPPSRPGPAPHPSGYGTRRLRGRGRSARHGLRDVADHRGGGAGRARRGRYRRFQRFGQQPCRVGRKLPQAGSGQTRQTAC